MFIIVKDLFNNNFCEWIGSTSKEEKAEERIDHENQTYLVFDYKGQTQLRMEF
jgi:hypothetical protein